MSISGNSSDKPSGSGKSHGSKSNYGPQRGKSKPKRGRTTGMAQGLLHVVFAKGAIGQIAARRSKVLSKEKIIVQSISSVISVSYTHLTLPTILLV